jgi:aryl-alcohol dehydrogenase-like predicted oxidoreductase
MGASQGPELREFGRTGMRISPVGLGTWAIGGGGWEFGWGPQDDVASIAAIRRAVELGMNWIDTAPVYGTGHAEEIVGRALKGLEPRPFVFTKVSLLWDRGRRVLHSLKRDSVRREVDDSLRRLGVSAVDLLQVHWPDPPAEIEEGWSALAELKAEGKVRHIGVSNFSVEQIRRIQRIAPVETLQPPYSIVRPEAEYTVLPHAAREGIGVIAYSPMACGLLSGTMTPERVARLAPDDWRRSDREFREPRLSRNLALARLLGEIGKPHGRSAGEVAIAWTLRNRAVTGAIVGARSARQVEGWAGALTFRLTPSEILGISEFVRSHP